MKRLAWLLLLTSCVTTPTPKPEEPTKPTEPAPIETKYPLTGWIPAYDTFIASKVTPNMLDQKASRMSRFCDVWEKLSYEQRVTFYTDLLYSIAYPESNYKNLSMFVEVAQGRDSTTGLPKVSEGLLQLSYSDARGYPQCRFDAKKDLAALKEDIGDRTSGSFLSKHPERDTLNPYRNLECGVAIIDKLLTKYPDQEFADLMGKYWSTSRRTSSAYKKVWQKMRERKSPCK